MVLKVKMFDLCFKPIRVKSYSNIDAEGKGLEPSNRHNRAQLSASCAARPKNQQCVQFKSPALNDPNVASHVRQTSASKMSTSSRTTFLFFVLLIGSSRSQTIENQYCKITPNHTLCLYQVRNLHFTLRHLAVPLRGDSNPNWSTLSRPT